ncbi:MAG: hypothetical protein ACRBN8_21375 [Nannocystales bacterium]
MDGMTLRGPLLALSILGLASGCAGHDDKEGKAPAPVATTPPTDPEPAAVNVKVSVASVQLQDDCPSAKPPSSADSKPDEDEPREAAMETESAAAARSAKGFAPMCTQSRVQLSIESASDTAQSVAIVAVRLKKADGGEVLGTMTTREPTLWENSKYNPWDESVAAGASIKVGYSLGDPNWAQVGKSLGGDTWGPMYIVELDVEVGGQRQTIASPKVPRDEPENIVT